jgi:23S rRNA (guanosine2251-2'-O)-methyltransferase
MPTDYARKKAYFDSLLTLFGRNPVMEALANNDVTPVRLHLADSNRSSRQLEEMEAIAARRGASIHRHSRDELARISRHRRQDQGVALDVELPGYLSADSLANSPPAGELVAIDQVTNPQNLGMILRTVAGSPTRGVILPRKGTAGIDGLVIKASAGALFSATMYHCDSLVSTLSTLKSHGYRVIGLDCAGSSSLADEPVSDNNIFVLGNESHGMSSDVREICDNIVRIPLENNVESLNVSTAAALVAFRSLFQRAP